jgi:hypothetical protein
MGVVATLVGRILVGLVFVSGRLRAGWRLTRCPDRGEWATSDCKHERALVPGCGARTVS